MAHGAPCRVCDSGGLRSALRGRDPVRGREDGAAGSVFGPFQFMHLAFAECARILRPGGVVMIFADWRRMADLGYLASITGLRPSTCVAWVRNRPGTGGLFRSSWDPILLVSRGVPDAVDRSAIRNVVAADYPTKRSHPYARAGRAVLARHAPHLPSGQSGGRPVRG